MCTSAQLGPALLYLLVAYAVPSLLLGALLAALPSVQLSRRLGVNRAVAVLSLIPVVGPAAFLWAVVYQRVPNNTVGSDDQYETTTRARAVALNPRVRFITARQ